MASAEPVHKLITASRVKGTPVFNRDGARIGHVEDLSIDKVTGQVRFALLAFGGFLGVGDRFHPLPWSALAYDTHRHGYIVQMDKPELEETAHYSKDQLEPFGAGDQEAPAPFL